jgi:hypothetical protein
MLFDSDPFVAFMKHGESLGRFKFVSSHTSRLLAGTLRVHSTDPLECWAMIDDHHDRYNLSMVCGSQRYMAV